MHHDDLQRLLDDVRRGALETRHAAERIYDALRAAPFKDMGFARVDTHREVRQGFPEVILGLGKTPAQIAAIAERIVARGQTLLVTRATRDAFDMVRRLARDEGVLAGGSGGGNVWAAVQVAKRLGPGKRVVTMVPDSAERYFSKGIFEE